MGLCLLLLNRTAFAWLLDQARRKGIYPPQRKPNIEDIKRLLLSGERAMAIRAYRAIYKLDLKQAELEVDLLERSLQKKI